MTTPLKFSRIELAYLDSNIISIYADGPGARKFGDISQALEAARRMAVRTTTSSVAYEEARGGTSEYVRDRMRAFKALRLKPKQEPQSNRKKAALLVQKVRDKHQHGRVLNDLRHLLMAISMGVDVIVTTNAPDFNYLIHELKPHLGAAPTIVRPEALFDLLMTSIEVKKRTNPSSKLTPRRVKARILALLRAYDRRVWRRVARR